MSTNYNIVSEGKLLHLLKVRIRLKIKNYEYKNQ